MQRVLEIVDSQYSMRIERTLCMKITQNGRIFTLDSGDNQLEELSLREITVEQSLKDNVVNVIKSLFTSDDSRTMLRNRATTTQVLGGRSDTDRAKARIGSIPAELRLPNRGRRNKRNILYQLLSMTFDGPGGKSKRSVIRVYDLGEKSNVFALVGELDYDRLVAEGVFYRAVKLMPVNPNEYKFDEPNIVSISPIPVFDSEACHLLVSLINGFRIYLRFRTQKKDVNLKSFGGFYRFPDRPTIKFEILDIKPPHEDRDR
jgi:hypothetical protein